MVCFKLPAKNGQMWFQFLIERSFWSDCIWDVGYLTLPFCCCWFTDITYTWVSVGVKKKYKCINYFRAQESDDLDEDKQGSRGTYIFN